MVNPQILPYCIGVDSSCLLNSLLALGVINNSMLVSVNWRPHADLALKIPDVAMLILGEVLWSVSNIIISETKHLLPFFIFYVLISPPPVSMTTGCYSPATTSAMMFLLNHLPLPTVSGLHLCINIGLNEKLYKWRVEKHVESNMKV